MRAKKRLAGSLIVGCAFVVGTVWGEAHQLVSVPGTAGSSTADDQMWAAPPLDAPIPLNNGRPLRVIGRFAYDARGGFDGVDNIYVEVRDQDPLTDSVVWTGRTDSEGYFDTGFRNWTEGDDPDLYVYFEANTPFVTVERGLLEENYSFSNEDNGVIEDFTGDFYDFGTLSVSDPELTPVLDIHNIATRLYRFIDQETGIATPNVEIIYPSGDFDFEYDGEITIGEFLLPENAVVHQYAHHFQNTQGYAIDGAANCGGFCELCENSSACPDGLQRCPFLASSPEQRAMKEGFAMWFNLAFCDYLAETYTHDDGSAVTCAGQVPLSQSIPFQLCDQCSVPPQALPLSVAGYVSSFLRDLELPDDTYSIDDFPNPPIIVPRDYNEDGFVECAAVGASEILNVYATAKPPTFSAFINAYVLLHPERTPQIYQVAQNYGLVFPGLLPTDTQAPGVVGADEYFSPTHTPETTLRTLPCIDVTWTAFDDDVSGGRAFSYTWSGSTPIPPDQTAEIDDPCPQITSPPFPPGDYFLNVRTQDWAGNWSSDFAQLGPFTVEDCNSNGLPDVCELIWEVDPVEVLGCDIPLSFCDGIVPYLEDCNQNFRIDECEIAAGEAQDCNLNGKPDGFPCENVRVWDGEAFDAEWNNPVNWESDQPPSDIAFACIGGGNPDISVNVSGNAFTLGLASYENLTISSRLSINPGGLFTENFNSFNNGSLTVANNAALRHFDDLTIGGLATFSGNTSLEGGGRTFVRGGYQMGGFMGLNNAHRLLLREGDGTQDGRIAADSGSQIEIGSAEGGPAFTHRLVLDDLFSSVLFVGSSAFLHVRDTGTMILDGGDDRSISMPLQIDGAFELERGSVRMFDVINCYGRFEGIAGTEIEFLGGRKEFYPNSSLAADRIIFDNGTAGSFNIRGDYAANITESRGGRVHFTNEGGTVDYGDELLLSGFGRLDLGNISGQRRDFDRIHISSGFLDLLSPDEISTRELSFFNGTIEGQSNGSLLVLEDFDWLIGGGFRGIGRVELFGNTRVVDNFGSAKFIEQGVLLRNLGVMTLEASFGVRFQSQFVNLPDGVVDVAIDARVITPGGLATINEGEVRKLVGPGMATIETGFLNRGLIRIESGTLEFDQYTFPADRDFTQTDGAIELLGGDIRVTITSGNNTGDPGNLNLAGGQLTGTGTAFAHVVSTNDAIVRPGASVGTLTVANNYSQGPAATLAIEIGVDNETTVADQLAVGETATLDGTLLINVLPGTEIQPGDQFTILTAGDVQQSFAQVVGTQLWQVDYTPTAVIITALSGTSCTPSSVADLDGDCDVDGADYLLFEPCLAGFDASPIGPCLLADFDQSGVVNMVDLALLQVCASGAGQPPTCGQ